MSAWERMTIALRAVGGLLTILLFLGSGSGCETRDRENPFDPRNPGTHGEPALLDAVAGNAQVELSWDLGDLDDAERIRIRRTRPSNTDGQIILEEGNRRTGSFVDSPLVNGLDYTYRLEVLTPSGEWLTSSPEIAGPGFAEPWVGDALGGGMARLSPDGRDVLFRTGRHRDVLDIQIDSDRSVWVADWANGMVVHYDPDGGFLGAWDHLGTNTLVIDRIAAQIWVGSFLQERVTRFSREGVEGWADSTAGQVEDLAPGLFPDGGVWVASRSDGVRKIAQDRVIRTWADFSWPVSLSLDPRGTLWVVDRGRAKVSRITLADDSVRVSPAVFVEPRDSTLDGEGGIWVADPRRGGVVHLDASGAEIGFLAIGAVDAVTYDPPGDRLWVVIRDEGRVSVYDPDGTERSRLLLGGRPVKVEGAWDGSRGRP